MPKLSKKAIEKMRSKKNQLTVFPCDNCGEPLRESEIQLSQLHNIGQNLCTGCITEKLFFSKGLKKTKDEMQPTDEAALALSRIDGGRIRDMANEVNSGEMAQDAQPKVESRTFEYEYIGATYKITITNEAITGVRIYNDKGECIFNGNTLIGAVSATKEGREIMWELKKKNLLIYE